jgi:hypothetical protein
MDTRRFLKPNCAHVIFTCREDLQRRNVSGIWNTWCLSKSIISTSTRTSTAPVHVPWALDSFGPLATHVPRLVLWIASRK